MKKIKAFWYVFKNSLYNVEYYKDILKVKKRFSLKYFFSLAAVATVITTTAVAVPLVPKVKTTMDNLLFELSQMYPPELVISAENGEWAINQDEPYIIETPSFFIADNEQFPKNLIIFDHGGTINDVQKKDTLMLVNEANIITLNNKGNIEAYPLDNIPNGEVNKQKVDEALNNVRSYLGFVPFLIIFFVLLGTLFYFTAFRLVYLLVVALVLLAIGNIKQMKYEFSDYYKLALHTITLPLVVEVTLTVLGIGMVVPFAFMFINIIFGIAVIYYLSDTKGKKSK
jgi:hypothetical protein